MSLVLTYEVWGMFAVILGLVILGFGIVPIAVLATLFHAEWGHLADLALLIVATFGARALAYWLGAKVSEEYTQLESKPIGGRWSGPPTRTWIVFCCTIGALLAIVIIFGGRQQSKEGLSAVQVFSETAGSVVRVENDRHDGSQIIGTGFVAVLEGHTFILTNKHVVENADGLKVGVREDHLFDIANYSLAKDCDLALVEVPAGLRAKALTLRTTPVQPGEIVFAIGFPMGLAKSITQGLITAIYVDALQFDAPISSGNSGGPVLDLRAEVVGVAARGSKGNTEEILQNLNFAVPVTNFPPLASFQPPQSIRTPTPFSPEDFALTEQTPSVGPTVEVRRALPPNMRLSTPNSTPLSATPPSPTPGLNDFVKQFVTSGNSGPEIEISFYADQVDYFDNGKVTKEFVVEDIKKYNQRWPGRRYWVDGEPKVEMVDSARDVARAIVTLEFVVQNRQKTIWGSCENVIFIRDASTNPKVMSVRSKLLSRHEKPSSG